jgi:hypothetical protein
VRSSSQFGWRGAVIHIRIAARQKYAISFADSRAYLSDAGVFHDPFGAEEASRAGIEPTN